MKTLDINECAEFLKIERSYALKLAGEGELPGAKIGRAWVFLEDDLVEYLRSQVRIQQRQRAMEHEARLGLEKSVQAAKSAAAQSPLVLARRERRAKVDLSKYEEAAEALP